MKKENGHRRVSHHRTKKNDEFMWTVLKFDSTDLNKVLKNTCFTAGGVEVWKKLIETLKRKM